MLNVETTSSLYELFQTQASTTPESAAVAEADKLLSYTALAERVDQIARNLRTEGVQPGDIVALLMPRSIDVVAAMLGILKAGAGYLPIDPKYPTARIQYMLADSGARRVITTNGTRLANTSSGMADVGILDFVQLQKAAAKQEQPIALPTPESVAYVIYTSGSTGVPKGVAIPHRALANYIQWARSYYVSGKAVDMPLFSSLAFDLTVTSIYLPLVTGGRVVVYPEDGGALDLSIYSVIKDNQVDMIKLTPSHLALVGHMDLSNSRVRKLILGGEDLKANLVHGIHRALNGQVEIYNEYGPTEATVGCMEYQFNPDVDRSGSVPIGMPIAGAEILVLDPDGQAVTQGTTGEIFIGGRGLAIGYVNQPELTRSRFVPHPNDSEQLVYRTGDLARYRIDGILEYAGRVDRQVKIGGVRIELDEVEAVLEEHPGVRSAAVTLYTPNASQKKIVRCARCTLPSNYPGVRYDGSGVCNHCLDYERYREQALAFFGTEHELRSIFDRARAGRQGNYDCLLLFSGGAGSTYVLYQLLAMDLKVLAYTLDNGYTSDAAKDNIRRITETLGVDHVFGSTDAMNAVFRRSLEQYSNLQNGYFRTIYALAMQLAHELAITHIVTGLTRGQLFENRLDFLFQDHVFDPETIEGEVERARGIYPAQNGPVAWSLPQSSISTNHMLGRIRFVDYFRYSNVNRTEVVRHLANRRNWIRPPDTGQSVNCLLNDVEVFVHGRERGFHNRALPYSWDVRLGLLDREEAIKALDTQVDLDDVAHMLDTIGYRSVHELSDDEQQLVAYYVAEGACTSVELERHLAAHLPASTIPSKFIELPGIPLTVNGKVDWQALPTPSAGKKSQTDFVAPRDDLERRIAEIWERVLKAGSIGVHDEFFDIGGTSVLAVLLYTQIEDLLDGELPDPDTDDGWTIAEQARLLLAHGYIGGR